MIRTAGANVVVIRRLVLMVAGLTTLLCGAAAGVDIRSPGKWLVDLGRDYPLTQQAGLSEADAEITLLFMQAAARIEPGLAEAYRWQIDLLRAVNRGNSVRPVLATYLRLAPEDIPARLAWVRVSLDELQTSGERAAFCREQLADKNLPRVVSSELHRQLADFHWNRGDETQARQEAEAALRDAPYNIGARQFLMSIAPPEDRWLHHVAILATRLQESPGDADAAWRLADELSLHGLAAEAEVWYRHAQQLFELTAPGQPPTGLVMARAAVLMELNRLDEAEALVKQAVQAERQTIDTLILRAQVALLKGDAKAAEGYFKLVSQLCQTTIDKARVTQASVAQSLVADIAWVFAHYVPQEKTADQLSQAVLANDPKNLIARRTLGTLRIRQQEYADAKDRLSPLADEDLWSAIGLAEAFKKLGQGKEAAAQLRALTTRPANFEQRHLIQSMCQEWEVEFPATQPAVLAAQELMASLKPEKRDYPFHPEKCLSAVLSVPQSNVMPGEPWWCTLRLVNTGTFPITIGNNMMLDPGMLILVEARGDRRRSSDGTIHIMLDRRFRLMPGDALDITQTLDIGPLRAGMIGTPQIAHDVQVTGVVNPRLMRDDEGQEVFQPGVGGFRLTPSGFRRVQLRVDGELMKRLAAQVHSGTTENRILAMEQLAMLLGEYQHMVSGRVRYVARSINPDVVQAAVLAMADDTNWYMRARLAECMRWFVLDSTTMPTAIKLLNDSHWLVRSLARRLLADQHGDKFTKVLESSSQADPDDWAKQFARALIERQNQSKTGVATTQPAEAGGS